MSGINEIFSEDNIRAYSKSCIDLAIDMAETKYHKFPFDTLMIPSRGAFPFFLGMTYALRKFGNDVGDEYDKFYRSLAIQPMFAPLMPPNSEISTDLDKKDTKVLLIPFTADLNIPKFDSNADNDEYTRKTREYWARVTESFLKGHKFREKNPYFGTFVNTVLRKVENRSEVAESYEKFPAIGTFAMIDTVISGRASNDILRAFDDIASERYNARTDRHDDAKPCSFLIVDENGSKLVPRLEKYLREKVAAGMAKMYEIPRIVSEDENSTLLGVSAVTYPSIMRASRDFEYRGKEFFVGAGSWHVNPKSIHRDYFMDFMDLIYSGIDAVYSESYGGKQKQSPEKFLEDRIKFVELAESREILSLKDYDMSLKDFVRDCSFDKADLYETGSHVLHIPFSEKVTREIVNSICNTYGVHGVNCKQKKHISTDLKKENGRAAIRSGLPFRLS